MRWREFDRLENLPSSFFSLAENGPRRVHFIGIGGIGMSALALLLRARGHAVSGSDANSSATLSRLRQAKVLCTVGHAADNLEMMDPPCEAVIFGSAISETNPEYAAAKRRGIPVWHRAQLLAYFVNSARISIAVSGTHGKSSTSAMLSHILEECGMNPTAILGAEYPPFGSNARIGDADLIVVEADESDGSFTLCHPTIALITNVEPEHLENYDDSSDELWRAFELFTSQAQKAILNADDPEMFARLKPQAKMALPYSLKTSESPEVGVPGVHNQSNAMAAITAAELVGVSRETAYRSVRNFRGIKRRFQKIGEAGGIAVYDDYAHHPTEVESTLRAARDFLRRPVLALFQPHRYSRTQQMGADFGPGFAAADKVIITELYSAFEEPIPGVSGRIVFDAVRESLPDKPVYYARDLTEARRLATTLARSGDLIFTMGAGDVTHLAPQLISDLKKLQEKKGEKEVQQSHTELLARHTTMKIGGPAQIWLEPQTEEELSQALQTNAQRGTPLFVLGAGSNLLADDRGFKGAVLRLGKSFAYQRVEGEKMTVGGAAMMPKLTHFALKHNLGDFEWACGIPGTVGGSIWGNAGARGWNGKEFETRDCSTDLVSLTAFERDGTRRVLQRDEIEFSYRKSSLGDLIVTEATFALKVLSPAQTIEHKAAVKELLARRRATQPVNAACAGCIWKNPKLEDGEFAHCGAGELIEKLGFKGMQIGGAQISEIHGNFIINTGDATYADVWRLITKIEEKVQEQVGIQLEREVRFLK